MLSPVLATSSVDVFASTAMPCGDEKPDATARTVHAPAPASTAVPAAQRPGQSQSAGGAAPPGHADPAGQRVPAGDVLARPHAKPGAAAHAPAHAESLPPVAAPHVPAAHASGAVVPGHQ